MINVSHLTKCYGKFKAIDDLSFDIEDGHIYGFLGPNGAGKSTTMNIMTGCLSATEGTVTIDGLDIFEDAKQAKKLIGYLPEIPPLYQDMTPNEYLSFVASAKGVAKADIKADVARVCEETGIQDVADRLIKALSKGYKQRVGIAQALLGNPKVIILDEPTVGLDPLQIIDIRDLIKSLGQKHTVILSSHILSEVQAIADTVMILISGKLTIYKMDTLNESLEEKFIELVKKDKAEKAALKAMEAQDEDEEASEDYEDEVLEDAVSEAVDEEAAKAQEAVRAIEAAEAVKEEIDVNDL